MLAYLAFSVPTILLSLALGAAYGWVAWGRPQAQLRQSHRAAVRDMSYRFDRELADRDETIAILRQELADEAGEVARLRRLFLDSLPAGQGGDGLSTGRDSDVVLEQRLATVPDELLGVQSRGGPGQSLTATIPPPAEPVTPTRRSRRR